MSKNPDYVHGQPKPVHRPGAESMHVKAVESICERREYGRNKYGTDLQIGNGRDFLTDAHEEAVDLLAYLEGLRAEREIEKMVVRMMYRLLGYDQRRELETALAEIPEIPWIKGAIQQVISEEPSIWRSDWRPPSQA